MSWRLLGGSVDIMEPPEHRGQEVDSCMSYVNNYERGFSFYSQEDTSAWPSAVDVPTEGVAGSEGKSSSLNPSQVHPRSFTLLGTRGSP